MDTAPQGLGVWEPLSLDAVAALFASYPGVWWIAGGWALDLFAGQPSRTHDDVDVEVLRRDIPDIRRLLAGWDLRMAGDGELRPWLPSTSLPAAIHTLWCRRAPDASWSLELVVGETDGDTWRFRRDGRVSRLLETIRRWSPDGIPYLAPEIQLLYKAKAARPKDQTDWARIQPLLDADARRWLREALAVAHPGHPWLAAL